MLSSSGTEVYTSWQSLHPSYGLLTREGPHPQLHPPEALIPTRKSGGRCWVVPKYHCIIFLTFRHTDPEGGQADIFLKSQESHPKSCQLGRQVLRSSLNDLDSFKDGKDLTVCLQSVFEGGPLTPNISLSLWSLSSFYFLLQTHCPSQSYDPAHSLKNPTGPTCQRSPGLAHRVAQTGHLQTFLL